MLAAIYAEPLSDAPRLVYADWLQARGDALGELIALQISRKAKGKRTQSREKLLHAAEGKGWWADHPCAQFGGVRWEDTERGFPAHFRAGWPVSEPYLKDQEQAVSASAGNPGWSTVTTLGLSYELRSAALANLLRVSRFVSLERVTGMSVTLLDRIADLELPALELELFVQERRVLPVIRGFPKLRQLTVDIREPVARCLEAVRPSGLLERLTSLELRGVEPDADAVMENLGIYAALPSNLTSLLVNQFYGQWVELTGDKQRPDIKISMTAHQVEATAEALERLDPETIGHLAIEFTAGGYFTKRERPALLARMADATKKWAGRRTLPS